MKTWSMEVKLCCDGLCNSCCQCPGDTDMVHFNQKVKWKLLYKCAPLVLLINDFLELLLSWETEVKWTKKCDLKDVMVR